MHTYEAVQVKIVKIEIEAQNRDEFINYLDNLNNDILANHGIYRLKEISAQNNKWKFNVEFPIWERNKIAYDNLEKLKEEIEKRNFRFTILQESLESKLVDGEDYPYVQIGVKILKNNEWAQREVLGKKQK